MWRVYRHTAYALQQPDPSSPTGRGWVPVSDCVGLVWVGEGRVWVVGLDGAVALHSGVGPSSPFNLQPAKVLTGFSVLSVKESGDRLAALSSDRDVYVASMETVRPRSGSEILDLVWTKIQVPCTSVAAVAPRGDCEMWLVDSANNLYFSLDVMEASGWSQVPVVTSDLRGKDSDRHAGLLSPSLCRPSLVVTTTSVFLLAPLSDHILASEDTVRGYCWTRVAMANLAAGCRLKQVHPYSLGLFPYALAFKHLLCCFAL